MMAAQAPIGSSKVFCANCGVEAAFRCVRCAEGLNKEGELSQTFYCSKTCQTAHWSTHKTRCKHANFRKQLYRAGTLAQGIYYVARELAFDFKVAAVKKKGNDLLVEMVNADKPNLRELLVRFPSEIFKNEEDKHAMLSFDAFGDGVDRMAQLVEDALEGTHSKIEEIMFGLSTTKLRIKSNSIPAMTEHIVDKVFLKDGNVYAFDLAAAQFGISHAVTPWETYQQKVTAGCMLLNSRPFGSFAAILRQQEAMMQTSSTLHLIDGSTIMGVAQVRISECLKAAVATYLEIKGMSVTDIVRAKNEEFAIAERELREHVSVDIAGFVQWTRENGGLFELVQDPDIFVRYQASMNGGMTSAEEQMAMVTLTETGK